VKRVAIGALVAVLGLAVQVSGAPGLTGARGFSRAIDPEDPDARLIRLERWLKASLAHHPGEHDDSMTEVSLWSNAELRVLRTDIQVLVRLFRQAGMTLPARVTDDRRIPPYTAWQIRHLVALGDEYRGRNRNDALLVRGAVLHGDVAMSNPAPVLAPGAPDDTGRIKVSIGDGESLGLTSEPVHWEMARSLFDLAKATAPAQDIARRWYAATAMWMQDVKSHDTAHLQRARVLFPQDVDILFMSGTQQETYASPPIQTAARMAVLPLGYHVSVGSQVSALRDAEGYLRQVLQLNPDHHEARLHLGHVLMARGRWQEATDILRPLVFPDADRELQYFAVLFLGAAEEGSGRLEQAREAYQKSSALYPLAQSPYIALSALATRRGDRVGALKDIQHVFDMGDRADDRDPWWAYDVIQAKAVQERLFALDRAVEDYR
jgi:tetratricopeptide (TPR) repeat protein